LRDVTIPTGAAHARLNPGRRLFRPVLRLAGRNAGVHRLPDPGLTVVQNVARSAPAATDNQIRAQLARFLFRGRRADQRAGTLSGGELFRAALATLLLAEPAPQLLLLDEPTNNLDMASVRQLSGALRSYEGALIVASHDVPFLRGLGLTRWLRIDGELADIDPL
jgi:ATPase subunit of ABC transporter with duplicated ATPase domains